MTDNKIKLITLWLLTIIGMILHFNYHVSGIFYGIDVQNPDAKGVEPASLIVIRTLFYHFPMIWILFILYLNKKWMNVTLFVISVLYLLAHASHLINEIRHEGKNLSQVSLLFFVLIIAGFLAFEHYKYLRAGKTTSL